MSLIATYKKFRADLRGWVPTTFDEFRTFFEPLCRRSAWSSADETRLRTTADSGGAHALRNLYIKGKATKPLIEKILGSKGLEPESMSREELDTQMRYLIDNCLRDEWNPATFMSFGAYLDSDKGPESLAASAAAPSSSSMFQSGQASGSAPAPAAQSTKTPERDLFAEKYRSACKSFQATVQTHLRDGARRADSRLREAEKIAVAATEPSQAGDDSSAAADIVAYPNASGGGVSVKADDDACSSDILAAFRPTAKADATKP